MCFANLDFMRFFALTDHCLVQTDWFLCLGQAVGGLDGMVQLQHSGSYRYSGICISPEAEFMTVQFRCGFLGISAAYRNCLRDWRWMAEREIVGLEGR
jgi:hypothetical protein